MLEILRQSDIDLTSPSKVNKNIRSNNQSQFSYSTVSDLKKISFFFNFPCLAHFKFQFRDNLLIFFCSHFLQNLIFCTYLFSEKLNLCKRKKQVAGNISKSEVEEKKRKTLAKSDQISHKIY